MSYNHNKIAVGIVFGKWLPYHFSRLDACVNEFDNSDYSIIGFQYSSGSLDYGHFVDSRSAEKSLPFYSLDISATETGYNPVRIIYIWAKTIAKYNLRVVLLPSYWNWSVTMRAVCFLMGCRVIMMNESHAGTEKARGFRRYIKKFIVSRFDGAIVGGEPHLRYFSSLGLPTEQIVTGYDAVDNNYFRQSAELARKKESFYREQFKLPKRYFLSLGRMVEKKNLVTLIRAYAEFKINCPASDFKLVFVGSGECVNQLYDQCLTENLSFSKDPLNNDLSDVLFYGFRQINENPIFYALAQVFILPSVSEEWGLVVNEAMACSLPVIVSETVGSAEDLVVPGYNGYHFDPRSSSDLASQMLKLADDPDERERMSIAAQQKIQGWGCENFAKKSLEIIKISLHRN